MGRRNPWKTARLDAGKTLLDATVEVRKRAPESSWVDPTKLSRFENGGPAKVDAIALGVLAELYGKKLRALDPAAADELDQLRELVGTLTSRRRKYAPRDSNPEPAEQDPAGIVTAVTDRSARAA